MLHLEKIVPSVEPEEFPFPTNHFGLNYFPDQAICFLSKKPQYRFFMVADNSTRLMEGPTIKEATSEGVVLEGSAGEFDNGYAGISSKYVTQDKLLAFYHAEDREGTPMWKLNHTIPCGYWSIGLAVSNDNGLNFRKLGAILQSATKKSEIVDDHIGLGDACVVENITGDYLLAYYTDLGRRTGRRTVKIAMAQCRIDEVEQPSRWFKYRNGMFSEAGLGGEESPLIGMEDSHQTDCFQPHVVYVPDWKKYLMVFVRLYTPEISNPQNEKSGVYFCHSREGRTWSNPEKLFSSLPIPIEGRSFSAHPALDIHNVNSSEINCSLLYCHSPSYGSVPHFVPHRLASRPITFRRFS